MGIEYSVEGKYLGGAGYYPHELVQIGTRFGNGKVSDSLEQLLELFRFVEQSLVIMLYAGRSLSSGVEIEGIFDKAASTVEAGVKKLRGRESPENPPLLRTQSESAPYENIESVLGKDAWDYMKPIADSYGLKTVGDLIKYIHDLTSTNKPFYSKWGKNDPLEFFVHSRRFSYASQEKGFEYWNELLEDDTPIIANDIAIRTWGDIKEALHGDNRIMDESKFSQGTFRSRSPRNARRPIPTSKN